jgi:putative transposase
MKRRNHIMREWQNQSHVRWYCRYHIVSVPKYRQKAIFGTLRKDIGKILRELCDQMGIELVEGHAMPDHVHLCLSIPPKYSVANAVGRLKGKAAIRIHREYLGRTRNFTGLHFWARGYCVSTVGLDEAVIRQYIRRDCLTGGDMRLTLSMPTCLQKTILSICNICHSGEQMC